MAEIIYTLLIHMLNFVVLFVLLWFILYAPIRKQLKVRADKIAAQMDKAKNAEAYAEEQRVLIDQELEEARKTHALALDTGMQDAREQSNEILKAAHEQSTEMLKETRAKIEMDKQHALQDIRERSVSVGMEVASAIISRNITVEDNNAIIDEYFSKVESGELKVKGEDAE